jgi:hypothetical protein
MFLMPSVEDLFPLKFISLYKMDHHLLAIKMLK